MLPFLNKDAQVGAPTSDTVRRKRDEDSGLDIFEAMAEDVLNAIKDNNKSALASVFKTLCEYKHVGADNDDQ